MLGKQLVGTRVPRQWVGCCDLVSIIAGFVPETQFVFSGDAEALLLGAGLVAGVHERLWCVRGETHVLVYIPSIDGSKPVRLLATRGRVPSGHAFAVAYRYHMQLFGGAV